MADNYLEKHYSEVFSSSTDPETGYSRTVRTNRSLRTPSAVRASLEIRRRNNQAKTSPEKDNSEE